MALYAEPERIRGPGRVARLKDATRSGEFESARDQGRTVVADSFTRACVLCRKVEPMLAAVESGAGCTLQDVVKAVVYPTGMADYPRVNAVYEEALAPNRPARTCVAVSASPVRERMKIETVAFRGAP